MTAPVNFEVEPRLVDRLERVKEMPRSVSQLDQYLKCPHAYYRARVLREWQRPAAWLPQGLAVHETAEVFELTGRRLTRAQAEDIYSGAYVRHTDALTADTPRWDFWSWSGPYDGQTDIERRFGVGLEQVGRYLDYYAPDGPGADEVIWRTPDGTRAVELEFEIDLDGVRVRGFIDQVVMVRPTIPKPKSRSKAALAEYEALVEAAEPRPRPRDIKTGNKPGGTLQLGTYGVALEDQYGIKCDTGDYWMARQGKPTAPYDLSEWTRETIAAEFKAMDAAVKAEQFDPKPEPDKCRMCSVNTECPFSLAQS